MSNTITLRPVPSHPTKSAMLLEPLDYLMLSDDNAARIDGVYIKGRTVAIIGRTGALYPFFRSSALLRHLDGQTRNVPVVVMYPGEKRGTTGLSFMGRLNPDNDYRPRIYP